MSIAETIRSHPLKQGLTSLLLLHIPEEALKARNPLHPAMSPPVRLTCFRKLPKKVPLLIYGCGKPQNRTPIMEFFSIFAEIRARESEAFVP